VDVADSREQARQRFDNWSTTYQDGYMWRHYFSPIHDIIQAHVLGTRGSAVLDVACGTGDMLRRFSRDGAAMLAGVDESEGMLSIARELSAGYDKISYAEASAESLPFGDASFDVVTSCVAFHHFPDPEGAIAEMYRVMRPGGRLFLCDLRGGGLLGRIMLLYGKNKGDMRYFTEDSMKAMCTGAGFVEIASERVHGFPPTILIFAFKEK